MDTQVALKHAFGLGSLAFGVAGVLKPSLAVRLTGASVEEARGLGFRDLAIGTAIYLAPGIGFAQRAIVDVGDAIVFARRKPAVAALGAASAAIALYGRTRA